MKRSLITLLLALAGAATAARAQTPAAGQRPGEDPLAQFFFPPELVLLHAQELGLQPGQRSMIVNAVKETEHEMVELRFQMVERTQELMRVLGGGRLLEADGKRVTPEQLPEAAVLDLVDPILLVEREIKRRQLRLLIRIRNALTAEQRAQLSKYRQPQPRPDGEAFQG